MDDGYLDFQEVFFPVAKRFGIRPVLFVPTGFVGQGVFWWDKLYLAILRSPKDQVTTPVGDFEVDNISNKEMALQLIGTRLKQLPFDQVMQIVDSLYDDLPEHEKSAQRNTLDWEELRALACQGVTIAAHSHTHPLLSRIPFDQACDEIRKSQEIIRSKIGNALPIFAFPDGKPEFFTPELLDFLQREGFQFVVTTIEGSTSLMGDTLLHFPRLAVWPGMTLSAFHYHVTPAYNLFK